MWKTRKDFEMELIAKTWRDTDFKKRLLADPKAVVEEISGEKLPKNMKVKIFEEDQDSVYLVLPRDPDAELSDDELSKVAGGVKVSPEEKNLYIDNLFNRF